MTESYDRAMNQAMTYLGARARSAKQMADYLEKKGHDERTIAQVMEKLTEYRFIDDESARALIEKKLRGDDRPDALRRAVQAAMRRGFPYDAVREAAQNLQEDVEWEE